MIFGIHNNKKQTIELLINQKNNEKLKHIPSSQDHEFY